MSCTNGQSPIDINMSNINNCNLKCQFTYKYSNVNPIIENNSDYLKLSYENTNQDLIIYNDDELYVQEIRIYTPSLHSYNSQKTDGEMIIVHTSKLGKQGLLVCIPIKNTNSNTPSSNLLSKIISTASSATPSEGLNTTLNTTDFNLNTFLLGSNKPFFNYNSTLPYQPCNMNINIIVYSIVNGNIDITTDSLNTLQKIITTNVYDVKTGGMLFYNSKGANSTSLSTTDNEIYIDCQPTDVSEETTQVVTQSYTIPPINFGDLTNNTYLKIGSFTLLIFLIIIIFYFLLHKVTNSIK